MKREKNMAKDGNVVSGQWGKRGNMPGNQLKQWAKQRGMSGAELAVARGVRPETVSRHMNDRTEMSMNDYTEYAQLLDVDVATLIVEPIPMPVFGVLDRQSFVHPRHQSQVPLQVSTGGGRVSRASIAILQPRQFVVRAGDGAESYSRLPAEDMQSEGMFMVHAPSLSAKEIPQHCLSRLCLVSTVVDGRDTWLLGNLYLEPHHRIHSGGETYSVAPYWRAGDVDILTGLTVEAAAPVMAKIYAPDVAGYVLEEVQSS